MKVLIRIILCFLTIVIIFCACIVTNYVYNKINGRVGYFMGYTSFVNTGTSMMPLIKPGDLLIIKKQNNYIKDDIISFLNDENIVTTHRIIDINNSLYITKGDSNSFIDGFKVSNNDTYGKLIMNITIFKYINEYKYYILGIVFIVPILLYIFKGKKCS